jgi:hypothetical protein
MTERRGIAGADLDRRGLLRGGLIWGATGALAAEAAAPSPALAKTGRGGGRKLTLDVACLGDTLRLTPAAGSDPDKGDLYASAFLVRGVIYKGEELKPGTGFDPKSKPGIGTWFCHGFLMVGPGLTLPDVVTIQEHVVGAVGPGKFGAYQLHSNGFEPHDDKAATPRSVIGGTGKYGGARGTVIESAIGTNATKLPDGTNAPNLRFEFRLRS